MSTLDRDGYRDKLNERLKTINDAIKLFRGAMRNYKEGPRMLPDGTIQLHGPLTKEAQIMVDGWEDAKRKVEEKLYAIDKEPRGADREYTHKEYKAPKKTNPDQKQEKRVASYKDY